MLDPRTLILTHVDDSVGWGPIQHLIELACRIFKTQAFSVRPKHSNRLRGLISRIGRFPSSHPPVDVMLCFAGGPGYLRAITSDPQFNTQAGVRIAWIIDSFWTDRIPKGSLEAFDLVVFMQSYDAPFYTRSANFEGFFLPWGTDALGLGSAAAVREIDVLRVGRQPEVWDDDELSASSARARGLSFQGRPPASLSYRELASVYRRAKYTLAFSNIAAPAPYTHPDKAYFTGRWTDAFACGSSVAGIPPTTDSGVSDLLWPEALLEFDTIDFNANLEVLRKAVADWSPAQAVTNHYGALKNLDWRWRFKELARVLGIELTNLESEIEALRTVIVAIEQDQ